IAVASLEHLWPQHAFATVVVRDHLPLRPHRVRQQLSEVARSRLEVEHLLAWTKAHQREHLSRMTCSITLSIFGGALGAIEKRKIIHGSLSALRVEMTRSPNHHSHCAARAP